MRLLLCVLLCVTVSLLGDGKERAFFLKDGRRIDGVLLGERNGLLLIKTAEGTKKVEPADIKAELSVGSADSLISILHSLGERYEWFTLTTPTRIVAVVPKSSGWKRHIEELNAYFGFLKRLFPVDFEQEPLIVVAERSDASKRLGLKHYGFYDDRRKRILVRADSSVTVLKHEAVHLFHLEYVKKKGLPQAMWVIEGLATLFENAEVRGDKLIPPTVSRHTEARRLLCYNALPPLDEFLKSNFASFYRNPAENYSISRCLLHFVFKKGLLRRFLKRYYATCKEDRSGRRALEDVFEKRLGAVEREFYAYVASLPRPRGIPPAGTPFIGVEVAQKKKRLHIIRVLRNSPVEGVLRKGDVLVSLDGVETKSFDDLKKAISFCRTGKMIRIQVLREESIVETEVTPDEVRD